MEVNEWRVRAGVPGVESWEGGGLWDGEGKRGCLIGLVGGQQAQAPHEGMQDIDEEATDVGMQLGNVWGAAAPALANVGGSAAAYADADVSNPSSNTS